MKSMSYLRDNIDATLLYTQKYRKKFRCCNAEAMNEDVEQVRFALF